jgi:hypothetical protein
MKIEWLRGSLDYPCMNLINLLLVYLKNNEISKYSYEKLIRKNKKIGNIIGNELLAEGILLMDKETLKLEVDVNKDIKLIFCYIKEEDDLYTLDTLTIASF